MLIEWNPSMSTYFLFGKITSVIYLVLGIIDWIGNGLIIAVTIRSKRLRSPCNIFIALQALTDIILQLSEIPYVYFAFNEILVTYRTCYLIDVMSTFSLDFSTLTMFFIALDRLIATKKPVLYRTLNPRYYIGGMVGICVLYCLTFKIVLYTTLTDDLTLCFTAQSATGSTVFIWYGVNLAVNLGIVAVYIFIRKTLKATTMTDYKTINRSLNTIIIVYIFGLLLGCLLALAGVVLTDNPRVITLFGMMSGTACSMNLAVPFFVYYFRSSIYHQEFRKMFGMTRKIKLAASSSNLQIPN